MKTPAPLDPADLAQMEANGVRREALVKRAASLMGWEYSQSPAWTGIRKVASAEAVAVGLDKLAAMLDRIEKAEATR